MSKKKQDERLVLDLSYAIRYAREAQIHLHVVCPPAYVVECRKLLIGCCPRETKHRGGVAHLSDKASVQVVSAFEALPSGPYTAFFIGAVGTNSSEEQVHQSRWRTNATKVVQKEA